MVTQLFRPEGIARRLAIAIGDRDGDRPASRRTWGRAENRWRFPFRFARTTGGGTVEFRVTPSGRPGDGRAAPAAWNLAGSGDARVFCGDGRLSSSDA